MSNKAISIVMILGSLFVAGIMLAPVTSSVTESQGVTYVYSDDANFNDILYGLVEWDGDAGQSHFSLVGGERIPTHKDPAHPLVMVDGVAKGFIENGIFVPVSNPASFGTSIPGPVLDADMIIQDGDSYEIIVENIALVVGSHCDVVSEIAPVDDRGREWFPK